MRKYARGRDLSKVKISWKAVADYIFEHGGSYHFGNTTCRKRWDYLEGLNQNGNGNGNGNGNEDEEENEDE